MLPKIKIALLACYVVAFAFASTAPRAEGQPSGKSEDIPWAERTWEQRFVESNYEDEFTNKREMVFSRDPFTWALSQEFAQRFGMPTAWIDPNLKGALALAWRTTTIGNTMCGYGSNPDSCWPPFTCQMDIYVDSSAPIPWRFNDVERDFFWPGLSSLDYVPRRAPAPRQSRYIFEDGRLDSKGPPFLKGPLESKEKGFTAIDGSSSLVYFDRAYAPGVTLLGFVSVCPDVRIQDDMLLRFFTQEEQTRTQGRIQNYTHTVQISKEFLSKIGVIYEQESEKQKQLNSAYQAAIKKYAPQ